MMGLSSFEREPFDQPDESCGSDDAHESSSEYEDSGSLSSDSSPRGAGRNSGQGRRANQQQRLNNNSNKGQPRGSGSAAVSSPGRPPRVPTARSIVRVPDGKGACSSWTEMRDRRLPPKKGAGKVSSSTLPSPKPAKKRNGDLPPASDDRGAVARLMALSMEDSVESDPWESAGLVPSSASVNIPSVVEDSGAATGRKPNQRPSAQPVSSQRDPSPSARGGQWIASLKDAAGSQSRRRKSMPTEDTPDPAACNAPDAVAKRKVSHRHSHHHKGHHGHHGHKHHVPNQNPNPVPNPNQSAGDTNNTTRGNPQGPRVAPSGSKNSNSDAQNSNNNGERKVEPVGRRRPSVSQHRSARELREEAERKQREWVDRRDELRVTNESKPVARTAVVNLSTFPMGGFGDPK